jgi:hypothetical protein
MAKCYLGTVFATDGKSSKRKCSESVALTGLPIDLLEQTLAKMDDDNGNVALWFAEQIKSLPAQ